MMIQNSKLKKIAIMGGTFNPIHNGHLLAAECARVEFNLDKVIFIPTGKPPHKDVSKVVSANHRYVMTELATKLNPFFEVSGIEIERSGLTYTIDTLKDLKNQYSDNSKLYFITGADTIGNVLSWKDYDEVFKLCKFIAVTRPSYNHEDFIKNINCLANNFNLDFDLLEIPALEISSTMIRDRIFNNKSIRYLVPTEVNEYIYKLKLYK